LSGGKKIWKIIGKILGILLSAALLVLAAVSLILAKPQEDEAQPVESPPVMEHAPALDIQNENELYQLILDFPAPVMSFMSGSGMTFVSGVSSDTAWNGRFARTATLYWQTEEGVSVSLQTIVPAEALSLLDGGFHFSDTEGPVLFGNLSIRMENSRLIRIHTATDRALYVLQLPLSLREQVPALTQSLQLFAPHTGE